VRCLSRSLAEPLIRSRPAGITEFKQEAPIQVECTGLAQGHDKTPENRQQSSTTTLAYLSCENLSRICRGSPDQLRASSIRPYDLEFRFLLNADWEMA
jgi:hypothetical protein